jgi:hypothetical protein
VSAVVRSWLAFAAVAAGIIHLALAVSSSVSIPLAIVGVLEFGWGLFAMAAARLAAPRATIAGAFVAVAASIGLLFLPDPPPAFPLLVAALFEFFIAATIAVHLRSPREARAPSTRRYVLGLLAGGIVVAALTLPALAATTFDGAPVTPSDFIDDHGH